MISQKTTTNPNMLFNYLGQLLSFEKFHFTIKKVCVIKGEESVSNAQGLDSQLMQHTLTLPITTFVKYRKNSKTSLYTNLYTTNQLLIFLINLKFIIKSVFLLAIALLEHSQPAL